MGVVGRQARHNLIIKAWQRRGMCRLFMIIRSCVVRQEGLSMEMQQIRYFLAVCQTLNFTRAAEVCAIWLLRVVMGGMSWQQSLWNYWMKQIVDHAAFVGHRSAQY